MDDERQQKILDDANAEISTIVSDEISEAWTRIKGRVEAKWPGISSDASHILNHLLRGVLHHVMSFMTGHVERTIMDTSAVNGEDLFLQRNTAAEAGRQVPMTSTGPKERS